MQAVKGLVNRLVGVVVARDASLAAKDASLAATLAAKDETLAGVLAAKDETLAVVQRESARLEGLLQLSSTQIFKQANDVIAAKFMAATAQAQMLKLRGASNLRGVLGEAPSFQVNKKIEYA